VEIAGGDRIEIAMVRHDSVARPLLMTEAR
jgi:hypothetical protein